MAVQELKQTMSYWDLDWIILTQVVASLLWCSHQKLNTLDISYVLIERVCDILAMKAEPFFKIILSSVSLVRIMPCNQYCYFLYSSEIYTWKNIIFDLTLALRRWENNFDKLKVKGTIEVFDNFETKC